MRKGLFIRILVLGFIMFSSSQVISQTPAETKNPNIPGKSDFKYIDNYYKASPKGLTNFMSSTKMPSDIKTELNAQLKVIKSKNLSAKIALYSGFAIGSGILLSEVTSTKDGQSVNSNTIYAGLGVWAVGGILNLALRPNKKHYIKFINTFNKIESNQKIELLGKRSSSRQVQVGVAINF